MLIPNGMRGLQSDCGSPPKLSNARFLKDALDGAAHLAVQPKRRTGHRSKAPVQWHLYPNAIHCWDCKEKDGFSKIAFNGQRVSYRFDAAVTQDSRERVFGFLRKSLQAN